jgi:putative ABC transport system permease protein
MDVLWYKVWSDLWNNKTRTLLAVLSIAAGVFAMGMMFGMSDLLITNLDKSHQAVMPSHMNVILGEPVDRDVLLDLRHVKGVEDVDPYNSVSVLYRLNPQSDWRQAIIQERDDFNAQKYELVQLRAGRWPYRNELGIERMAAQFLGVGIGDEITIKTGDQERTLPITGLIRHPFVPPPQFMDLAVFFMDEHGMERLGIPVGKFGAFYVRVTPYSADYTKEVATAIKDKLAEQNIRVAGFVYQDPNKHWGRTFFDGITLVLRLLALVSVVLGAVLVYNTMTNLITQQRNQIGVLKAIGGRVGTITQMYLVGALVYGILALVVALPLGSIVAFVMTKAFLNLFNIDYVHFEVSREALALQVLSALAVPVLASLPAVLQGARITVREAIASYGLGGKFGSSWMDRLIEDFGQRWLPSQYATSLGNLFRRKGRLLLTQVVLVVAGSAFLTVMSLDSSISLTIENIFARERYDTLIQLAQNQVWVRLDTLARSVQGVEQTELRLVQPASMFTAGHLVKEAGIGTYIMGIPAGSDFFRPLMVTGRWFQPGDSRVVVITRQTAQREGIQLGDTVTLDLGEMGQGEWKVIGSYEPVFASGFVSDTIYAPSDSLFKAIRQANLGSYLYVRTTSHSPEAQAAVTDQLKHLFERHNVKVDVSQTASELRSQYTFQFSTVTSMLLGLAIVVAVVGGIALMGALSIAVVERTKEIGVLRAVGAGSRTILSVYVMEGVLQGLLSWFFSIPIALLISPLVAGKLGEAMFGATLDYRFAWSAVEYWLLAILVISVLASILPARGATRISVRDSLAYA